MNSGLVQSIADLSSRWRSRFSRSKASSDPKSTDAVGARGEKLAAKFLRKNGYKILYRNFVPTKYGRGGQIDVVCRDDETLVFVEVKSLTGADRIRPLDHLTGDQRRRISQGALTWLRLLDNPDISFRFDVVEVTFNQQDEPRFELIRDAFQLSKPYIY
jgi:putative endonuclease